MPGRCSRTTVSSFRLYAEDNSRPSSLLGAAFQGRGRMSKTDKELSLSLGIQASDLRAYVSQSDTRARIRDETRNPAPKLRRAADGWGKDFQGVWGQKLRDVALAGWGFPGNRGASTMGGCTLRCQGGPRRSHSEQPSFCIWHSGIWDLDSRQQ